jgi:hypothetical protein
MARRPLLGVLRRREDHRGRAVSDLRAVVAPQATPDHRVVALVFLERVLREVPTPGLCVRVTARVLEAAARERREMLGFEPVAPVVLVAERGEDLGPDHGDAVRLERHPCGGTEVRHRIAGRHVAHHLDPNDASDVVAICLEVGHRGQHRDAAGRARSFMAGRRQADKRGIGLDEEAAEVTLAAVDLRREVRDVPHLHVGRIHARVQERTLHRLGEQRREIRSLTAPAAREVGLRATEHEDGRGAHGVRRCASRSDASTHQA